MRPLAILVAVTGLAVAGVAFLGLREAAERGVAQPPPPAAVAEPEAPAPPARPSARAPSRVRPVAPDVVGAPPVPQEALERIEDREPLGPDGRAHDPSEGPPRETILHRPVAVAAGLFEAQGHTVALAGIEVVEADEECTAADGASWPCGVHARTAFRNWLRGRALTCVVPPVTGPDVVVSDCTLATQNPAEWLAAQGWARAVPGGPYEELQAEARRQGRGLFGPAPATASPAGSGG